MIAATESYLERTGGQEHTAGKEARPCYPVPAGMEPHLDVRGYYVRRGNLRYFVPTDTEAMIRYLKQNSHS